MEHLLIIRFSAMGDVAMTVPIISALAEQYPKLHITVLSRPFAGAFFKGLAPNVSFMGADLKHEYKGLLGLRKLSKRLQAKQFSGVADFHDVLRSKLLRYRFWLSGVPVASINKHRHERQQLTAREQKVLKPLPTSFDNYAEVLKQLGYPIKYDFMSLFPSEGGDFSVLLSRIEAKEEGEQWIGVAPFAAHKGKMYPWEKMQHVIEKLIADDAHVRIFLFGGGEDELRKLDEFAARVPAVTNASRLLNELKEELILMSHLDVMVSMDSGNMHFASLVGTPVVSIWGATHPYAGFMGWHQHMGNAVQMDLSCRPCSIFGNKPCFRGDYACMNLLDEATIIARVKAVIEERKAHEKGR